MAKKTNHQRFIRWLVALAGGDPNQTVLPPDRTPVKITVQRHNGVHVAIIHPGRGGGHQGVNLVHLTGTVVGVDDEGLHLVPTDNHGNGPVRVCPIGASAVLLPSLQPGECVALFGEVDGNRIRAGVLWRISATGGDD